MLKYLFLFLVFTIIISCEEKNDSATTQDQNEVQTEFAYPMSTRSHDVGLIQTLLDSALNYGNIKAYSQASTYYLMDERGDEFLYYAFVMANKYKEPRACYDIYVILCDIFCRSQVTRYPEIDAQTRYIGMCYLLYAFENGESSAKYELIKIYGDESVIPSLSDYSKKANMKGLLFEL